MNAQSVLEDLERHLHRPEKARAFIGLKVSPSLKDYLEGLARNRGMNLSEFIKSCILKAISKEALKGLNDAEASE